MDSHTHKHQTKLQWLLGPTYHLKTHIQQQNTHTIIGQTNSDRTQLPTMKWQYTCFHHLSYSWQFLTCQPARTSSRHPDWRLLWLADGPGSFRSCPRFRWTPSCSGHSTTRRRYLLSIGLKNMKIFSIFLLSVHL